MANRAELIQDISRTIRHRINSEPTDASSKLLRGDKVEWWGWVEELLADRDRDYLRGMADGQFERFAADVKRETIKLLRG